VKEPGVAFSSTTASVILDAIRGLAALIVCVEHWRNLLFVDYRQLLHHKLALLVPYVVTDAGHQAVIIFFVLSGYLISGSIFRAIQNGQWSWERYMTHRLVLLWLVLVPALVLGLLWDSLGVALNRSPALYAGLVANHLTTGVAHTLNAPCFFGNLFFLQTIVTPAFGSNGALWSLANEFWYYLLFPLALCASRKEYKPLTRLCFAGLFVGCALFVGKTILLYFPIWLLGVLLWALPSVRLSSAVRYIAAGIYAITFFALTKLPWVGRITSDYVLAVLTFLMIWMMFSASERAREGRCERLARNSASMSYTLYLVHTPILMLLVSILAGDGRWHPGLVSISLALAVLLVTLVYAWAVAACTEFRTDPVRRWIENRLSFGSRRQPVLAASQTAST
jgi:peptidoglycan/LPS O-acetylase OafA/YrhL